MNVERFSSRASDKPRSLPKLNWAPRAPRQVFQDEQHRRWRRIRRAAYAFALLLVAFGTFFVVTSFIVPRFGTDAGGVPAREFQRLGAKVIAAGHSALASAGPASSTPLLPESLIAGAERAVYRRVGVGRNARWVLAPIGGGEPFPQRVGFFDGSDPGAVAALAEHGNQLTAVALAGLHVDRVRGVLSGAVPAGALQAARETGASLFEVIDDTRENSVLPAFDPTLGSGRVPNRFAEKLIARLREDRAAGAIVHLVDTSDDPGDPGGGGWRAFVQQVGATLRASGLQFAIVVDADFDPDALKRDAAMADLVFVRAQFRPSAERAIAPVAPHDWLRRMIGAARRSVAADKLVIVLPTRAMTWTIDARDARALDGPHEASWRDLVVKARAAGVTPQWDAETRNLVLTLPGSDGVSSSPILRDPNASDRALAAWLLDAATFADGLALLSQTGSRAVGIDGLGGEDPRIWQMLKQGPTGGDRIAAGLATVPAFSGINVIGSGVEVRVDTERHEGRAHVSVGEAGEITSERYDELPAGTTVICRGQVPRKTVVLTFDDGPDPNDSPAILDILDRHGVKATFFLIGAQVARHPEIVRRMVASGHEIGNHSFSHPDLATIDDGLAGFEIQATNALLEAMVGRSTVLFRPPFRANLVYDSDEEASIRAMARGQRQGMTSIAATIDHHDWYYPSISPKNLAEGLLSDVETKEGGVILMHDGGGDRSNTADALEVVIGGLQARGYRFVQVHDLFGQTSIESVNPPKPMTVSQRTDNLVWWTGTWTLRMLKWIAFAALLLGTARFGAFVLGAWIDVARHGRRGRGPHAPGARAVSVVIPAYNEAKVIERTIRAVLRSEGVGLEVIVVDDGSTDDTAKVVKHHFGADPRVALLTVRNGGKAVALNIGFAHASHDIVVALDADTLFLHSTIVELTRPFADPRVKAVAGRVVVGNPKGWIGRWQALEYAVAQAMERRAWRAVGVVSVVPGAVGAWRRDAVLAAGGFAAETLAEDCDLTVELQARGGRITYTPSAVALTEVPETVRALLKQRFRWSFGVLQTLWKHRRVLVHPPPDNRVVGLLLLPTVLVSHITTPLFAPLADLAAVVAISLGHGHAIVPYVIVLLLIELIMTLLALVIDRVPARLMADWIVNRTFYRWLLFIALARAVLAALRGSAVGWGKLARTGTVTLPQAEVGLWARSR